MIGIRMIAATAGAAELAIPASLEYWVVAGGGAGGGGGWSSGFTLTGGAGGGAGGLKASTLSVSANDILTMTIGTGGVATNINVSQRSGQDSILLLNSVQTVTAHGGGGGAEGLSSGYAGTSTGGTGGSGGGSTAAHGSLATGGLTTETAGAEGNNGGSCNATNYDTTNTWIMGGGGGGGSSSSGGGGSRFIRGASGTGTTLSTPWGSYTLSEGGSGGFSTAGASGASYGGGGGGGRYYSGSSTFYYGSNGKNGIVILRHPVSDKSLTISGAVSYSQSGGYRWYRVLDGSGVSLTVPSV